MRLNAYRQIAGIRIYQCGIALTGIGSCFFLAGIADILLRTMIEARFAFFSAGWFLTAGWLLERWGIRQERILSCQTSLWTRGMIAFLPLIIYFFQIGAASLFIHDEIAEAAYAGDLETVTRLAPFDPELSTSPGEFHYTPLCAAVIKGDRQIVEYLLSRGVDVNRPSDHGETPLKVARSNKRKDLEALLIAAGAKK